jgi:site-specific DNA-methyltransferase (adenine-specific)
MPTPAVQHVPIGSIKPNPSNPRTIRDERFHKLVQSIKDFPEMLELRPIVTDADRVVLGGNMRLKACKAAGLKTVPVVVADHLTESQRREFIVKDNVGFGDWDWDALANEWDAGELEAWGLEVPHGEQQLSEGLTDPDAVPDAPAEPVTKVGDRIVVGRHTLVCGDSTDAGAWDKLLAGRQIGMVWTDPPYGVRFSTDHLREWDGSRKRDRNAVDITNDDLDESALEELLRGSLSLAWAHCRAGAAWYVAAPPGPPFRAFAVILAELSVWRQTLSWVKDLFVLGRSDYHYQHEAIFYGWKEGAAHTWNGDRKQTTLLEFDRPKRSADHPTMKPVELVGYCIGNSSNPDDLIADPFGGSGTTLLAAERLGRASALIELDPRYCDVIVRRWEEFTGQKAIREQPRSSDA